MNPFGTISVKTFGQEGRTILREVLQLDFRHVQARIMRHPHDRVFPRGRVRGILVAGELGDPLRSILSRNAGFRASSTQRRAGRDQHRKPFFTFGIRVVIVDVSARFFKFAQTSPRRSRHRLIVVQEMTVGTRLEAQCPHAGFIVNAQQIIGFHQNPRRFSLAASPVCLPALHELPPPAIRRGIHEESEVRFQGELRPGI